MGKMEDIRLLYPETFVAEFISESGEDITNSHIGFISELEKLCDESTVSEGAKLRDLRPISNLKPLFNAQEIFLNTIEIIAYDTSKVGSSEQDADVNSAITDSKSTNDIYVQSQFLNAIMPQSWQPNFVRPKILIGNSPILKGMSGVNNADNNIVDLSIGEPLNRCINIQQKFKRIDDVKIKCACGQYISEESKIKNYPLLMRFEFWIGNKVGGIDARL